jgi:hypothetical protein
MLERLGATGALLTILLLASVQDLRSQALAPRLEGWRPPVPSPGSVHLAPVSHAVANSETRSHTLTGLLIGGLVGAAATGLFLAAFCSDADTQCGADEVGRAVLIIAVPPAVVGAVVGSLIRTKR